jgi:hypothetical protein
MNGRQKRRNRGRMEERDRSRNKGRRQRIEQECNKENYIKQKQKKKYPFSKRTSIKICLSDELLRK